MGLKQTILNLFTKSGAQPASPPMPTPSFDRDLLLDRFTEAVRNIYYYKQYQPEYDQLITYLRDGNVSPPTFQYGLYAYEIERAYWNVLEPNPNRWDALDDRLLAFAFGKFNAHRLAEEFYKTWLTNRINESLKAETIPIIVNKLAKYGVSEADFWLSTILHVSVRYLPDSALTQWIIDRVEPYHASALPMLQTSILPYLRLLLKRKPDFVKTHVPDFLYLGNYNVGLGLGEDVPNELLSHDAAYFGRFVADVQTRVTDSGSYRMLQLLLARYLPDQYQSDTLAAAYDYLELVSKANDSRNNVRLMATQLQQPTVRSRGNYFLSSERVEATGKYELTAEIMFKRVLKEEQSAKARDYLYQWLEACADPDRRLFTVLSDQLKQDSVPFLMLGLRADSGFGPADAATLATELLKLLAKYDYSAYYPQIWALTRHKSKQMREIAAVTLAKLGDAAIPEAQKLLADKKADARQTGALILSLIRTDRAQALLMDALDAEKNDDTRDLMLESLDGLLPVPSNEQEVSAMVEAAQKRGKLDAPVAPYLIEKDLPPLYWQSSGNSLNPNTVRFLLYRQNRSKDIRPDPEAKPIYAGIDRQRSAPFAKAVLRAYLDGGAEPKLKGCLTVGAMLGGDDEIDLLRAKVNQWVEGSRGKMAEYAVQAIALIGSNKALRAVEFYTRKYKNKNKNIGAAASEAFAIAAETLGISPYDLADSIIPDFGFDGLFRQFEAGGDTYRAFVGTDFKLAFLDDDNKLIKTVPKAASAALKDEFKEMGKEIREIVKAQSGRLEQYLVIQRRWPADKWQSFFVGNPVMFAYAVRLIWGVFDGQQRLLFTFQCQEDQTLVNEQGDEVELGEASPGEAQIGMVHPLSLTPEQIAHWSGQLADAGIEPIFPQLDRRVVLLPDEARKQTMDGQFEGVEHGGYGFVSKMEKLGWFRGSVQDGGSIASYYKDFSVVGLTALVTLQGNISVGYYDDNAILDEVMFVRAGSVRFGSYMYDEPGKDTDPRLIAFGEVPPIVYSEVMADLLFFRENDVRKNQK